MLCQTQVRLGGCPQEQALKALGPRRRSDRGPEWARQCELLCSAAAWRTLASSAACVGTYPAPLLGTQGPLVDARDLRADCGRRHACRASSARRGAAPTAPFPVADASWRPPRAQAKERGAGERGGAARRAAEEREAELRRAAREAEARLRERVAALDEDNQGLRRCRPLTLTLHQGLKMRI